MEYEIRYPWPVPITDSEASDLLDDEQVRRFAFQSFTLLVPIECPEWHVHKAILICRLHGLEK